MNDYDLGEVLRGQLQHQTSVPAERNIETITGEIILLKQDAGNAILGIGQRLNEAKSILSDGEWLSWLTEQVDFSPRTAQRFMRLAREWSDATALSHLGATKALTLLALPPEERESFMCENHLVDGEEKSVIDMTSRELDRAIRERDEARQAAAAANADARAAEDSRSKMAADMAALAAVHKAAQESEAQTREELESVRAALQALRNKPVEVAVEAVVDEEAIKAARAEAIAEMSEKLKAAEIAKKLAEEKHREAENFLMAVQGRLVDANQKIDQLTAEKSAVNVSAVVPADLDFAEFWVYSEQVKDLVKKMRGLLLKARNQGDAAVSHRFSQIISSLGEAFKNAAI